MAIFFDAPVNPDDLTVFVRQVPTIHALTLSNLFPVKTVNDNRVNLAEVIHTNRTARFRAYDGRIHVSKRDTASISQIKLPPLSSSVEMGEYERLQLEFARTGGTNIGALEASIYNDAQNLVGEIRNRMEQAWGDTLTDGKLTINEEGLVTECDFGVPANQLVTAGTLWSTLSAGALTDLIAWHDVYIATNGFAAGSIRTSIRVQRLLTQNVSIINAIKGATAAVSQVTLLELNNLLAANGLPQLADPYDTSVDVDGVSTRVIADNKLMFFPPNIADLGYTAYGLTATALELVNSGESDLSFADAPGIVGVVEKMGPPYRQTTFVDAVGMPIIVNARRLLVATVA